MKNRICLAITALSLTPLAGFAQTLPPLADTYYVAGNATNAGTATTITVGQSGAVGLVQFDLTHLPAGVTASQVQKATFTLFLDHVSVSGAINVDTVSASTEWGELTVNGNSGISAGNAVATSVPVATVDTFISMDATAAVQSWVTTPNSNNGFMIIANSPTSVQFDSKENTTTSHPATLTIILTNSGSTGATGPAGTSGPAGATGAASSVPGPSGPSGPAGASGAASNVAGPSGPGGPSGPVGATGAASNVAGPSGPIGPSGAASTVPGASGPIGPSGPVGATGAASNVAGPSGPGGPSGPVGATGAASNVAGPSGPGGPSGPVGATGAASNVAGPPGASGPSGPLGPSGAAGATGAASSGSFFYAQIQVTPAILAYAFSQNGSSILLASPAFSGDPTFGQTVEQLYLVQGMPLPKACTFDSLSISVLLEQPSNNSSDTITAALMYYTGAASGTVLSVTQNVFEPPAPPAATATGSFAAPAGSLIWLQISGALTAANFPAGFPASVIGVTSHCN